MYIDINICMYVSIYICTYLYIYHMYHMYVCHMYVCIYIFIYMYIYTHVPDSFYVHFLYADTDMSAHTPTHINTHQHTSTHINTRWHTSTHINLHQRRGNARVGRATDCIAVTRPGRVLRLRHQKPLHQFARTPGRALSLQRNGAASATLAPKHQTPGITPHHDFASSLFTILCV